MGRRHPRMNTIYPLHLIYQNCIVLGTRRIAAQIKFYFTSNYFEAHYFSVYIILIKQDNIYRNFLSLSLKYLELFVCLFVKQYFTIMFYCFLSL